MEGYETLLDSHAERGGAVASLPPVAYVGLAFLSYNMAIGMMLGVYGTLVETIERHFSTSRALASSGTSLTFLLMGLLSPMIDPAVRRWGLRSIMLTGAALCAAGYAIAAEAHGIYMLLAAFTLLIGPGVCLLGPIPSAMLVTIWVPEARRGQALGIACTPVFIVIFPFITTWLLGHGGLSVIFFVLAGLMAAIMPLLWLVREKPVVVAAVTVPGMAEGAVPGSLKIFHRPAFLAIALGTSLITAVGMIMATHLVSIGQDRGLGLGEASTMLAVYGMTGVCGGVLFGRLADSVSPGIALAICALVPILALLALDHSHSFLPLVMCSGMIGLCIHAIVALQSVAVGTWLGKRVFAHAMGVLYLFQVPFLFGAAPLAGFLVDRTGSYQSALFLSIFSLGLTAIVFLLYRPPSVAIK
jgi:MFS family permease